MIEVIPEIETILGSEPAPLTDETLMLGLHFLCDRDPDLLQMLTKLKGTEGRP